VRPPQVGIFPEWPTGPAIPSAVLNTMSKRELLDTIKSLCYNDEDPISFEEWQDEDMSVNKLRTIVRLLDNGGVDFFKNRSTNPPAHGQRSHCFFQETIKAWLESQRHQFPRRFPKHPVTNVPLTQSQINAIFRN
jgi:hypothetical protein